MKPEKLPLEQTTPEAVGLSSASVLEFINEMERLNVNIHSMMVLRDGKIAAEAYWAPYDKDTLHRIYSATKSFTSFAVGWALFDDLFKLDDPIVKFFPDKLLKEPHPYIRQMTVRDLLTMQTTNPFDPYELMPNSDRIRTFLNVSPQHRPGAVFNYDNSATYVLGAIIERLTGMKLMDYLRKKALDAIGFSEEAYILDDGHFSWSQGGMMCTLRDLAKFALLCEGNHYGFMLQPGHYLRDALQKQVDTRAGHFGMDTEGYGYQFWILDDGWSMSGWAGQFVFAYPKLDLIFVCNANTMEDPGCTGKIWETFCATILADAKATKAYPQTTQLAAALKRKIKSLAIKPVVGKDYSPIARDIAGKVFRFDANESRWKTISVGFGPDFGSLDFGDGTAELRFGFGHYVYQPFPCEDLSVISSGAWVDENTLLVRIESFSEIMGAIQILLHFEDENHLTMNCFVYGPLPNAARYRTSTSAVAEDTRAAVTDRIPKPDPSNPYSTTSTGDMSNPFYTGKPIFH